MSVFNLGRLDSYDVEFLYVIVDNEGNIVSSETENLKIEDSLSLEKKLNIPNNVNFGDYELIVSASYDSESVVLIKQAFKVGRGQLFSPFISGFGKLSSFLANSFSVVYLPFILAGLFVVILVIILIYYFAYLRRRLFEKKVEEMKKKSIYVFPDFALLPKSHFAYVGHVADSGVKTYLDHR